MICLYFSTIELIMWLKRSLGYVDLDINNHLKMTDLKRENDLLKEYIGTLER